MIDRVDPDVRTLVSMDERVVPFDLLVSVLLDMGATTSPAPVSVAS